MVIPNGKVRGKIARPWARPDHERLPHRWSIFIARAAGSARRGHHATRDQQGDTDPQRPKKGVNRKGAERKGEYGGGRCSRGDQPDQPAAAPRADPFNDVAAFEPHHCGRRSHVQHGVKHNTRLTKTRDQHLRKGEVTGRRDREELGQTLQNAEKCRRPQRHPRRPFPGRMPPFRRRFVRRSSSRGPMPT